jgi:hypothetical protein
LETFKGIDEDVSPLHVNGPVPVHELVQPVPKLTEAPARAEPEVSTTLTVIASVFGRRAIVADVPLRGEIETLAKLVSYWFALLDAVTVI